MNANVDTALLRLNPPLSKLKFKKEMKQKFIISEGFKEMDVDYF